HTIQFQNPGWQTISAAGHVDGCPYADSIAVFVEASIADTLVEMSFCDGDTLNFDFSTFQFAILDPGGNAVESFQTSTPGDFPFIAQNVCGQADFLIHAQAITYLPQPI